MGLTILLSKRTHVNTEVQGVGTVQGNILGFKITHSKMKQVKFENELISVVIFLLKMYRCKITGNNFLYEMWNDVRALL